MIKFESVTIRTAKNGFTVEPSLPLGPIGFGMADSSDKETYQKRADAQRPHVAQSIEDALTQAADLLGTPCNVTPLDSGSGSGADDSSMTSDPSEMF